MKIHEKIEEIFGLCNSLSGIGAADFRSICKTFWLCLNNSVTFVDLAGVFAVSIPPTGMEILTLELFSDFFKAFARIKFPTDNNHAEKLYEEIKNAKHIRIPAESLTFPLSINRNVIRVLLKYDIPIKRAYSTFCGQSVRVGGRLNWDEAKKMSIGMEIDGFISFAGAYSLIPKYISAAQCEVLFRDALAKYALVGNDTTLNSTILFPQFQMLLILIAMEKMEEQNRKESKSDSIYAKKVTESYEHALVEVLNELFRDSGISKSNNDDFDDGASRILQRISPKKASASASPTKGQGEQTPSVQNGGSFFSGTVILPVSDQPTDMYTAGGSHSKQAMLLRMEHLFDEIEARLLQGLPPEAEVLAIIASAGDESNGHSHSADGKVRLSAKPVVIGDALPIPQKCPDLVQQLLEAALAHHNLGSFEEALKFLEAANIQLIDIEFRSRDKEPDVRTKMSKAAASAAAAEQVLANQAMYFDLQMYIVLCKGNVYQSCGDDEQSMLHFMEGLSKAEVKKDKDWEMICINSIGLLAFYNLRYDVAAICFNALSEYRQTTYGSESAETATSWNNEACCLYCLGKRGEARVRFERAWHSLSAALGHRSARAITAWKNLEKARRSHAPLQLHNKQEQQESLRMRPDADRLLLGGTFIIQALAPPQPGGRRKKKGGGKKKKK